MNCWASVATSQIGYDGHHDLQKHIHECPEGSNAILAGMWLHVLTQPNFYNLKLHTCTCHCDGLYLKYSWLNPHVAYYIDMSITQLCIIWYHTIQTYSSLNHAHICNTLWMTFSSLFGICKQQRTKQTSSSSLNYTCNKLWMTHSSFDHVCSR